MIKISTRSAEETEQIAARIGQRLRGGECIEFLSDVGGGKTTFVRGLARGAGSGAAVSSPTFTISQQYKCPNFTLYHFDFYRLQDPGIIREELVEYIGEADAVVLIEWAETVAEVLPKERLRISIQKDTIDESIRTFVFEVPERFSYVIEGIQ